jgi:hypothetical protein
MLAVSRAFHLGAAGFGRSGPCGYRQPAGNLGASLRGQSLALLGHQTFLFDLNSTPRLSKLIVSLMATKGDVQRHH